MITTKQERLEPKEFFKLLVIRYFKKRWWLFALLTLITAIELSKYESDYFFCFTAILIPVIALIQCYRYAYSAKNESIRAMRHHVMTDEEITTHTIDGSMSQIKLGNFIKAEREGKYFLFFVSKIQYLIIKQDEFASERDRQWFQQHIFLRIKHQRV